MFARIVIATLCTTANGLHRLCSGLDGSQHEIVELLTNQLTDYGAFLKQCSPASYASEFNVPLFLFHADDDSMVPIQQTSEFVVELQSQTAM